MSTSRPVIGITAYAHLIDNSYATQICSERVLRSVIEVCDGVPLILPGMEDAAATAEWLEMLDGLVLTGARPNVHPSFYDEPESDAQGPYDLGRDRLAMPLTRAMIEAGKPVFGICRGIQEMNVAYGGCLHPEVGALDGRMRHRMPPGETDHAIIFEKRHLVRFREGGPFHRLLGVTETMTNSLHGQAVWSPGAGVVFEGWAEDETVEAISIEGARRFALGVQWHAEYESAEDPVSRALFTAFAEDARASRAERGARRGRRGAA